MGDVNVPRGAEGEQEALLYIAQIILGGATWLLVASVVDNRVLVDSLGFAAFCGLSYPFAKRTWAVGLPASRYLQFVVVGTAIIAGLRIVFR